MLQCCWGSDPHALAPDACGPCSIPYREMIGCKRGWTRREFLVERAAATAQITSLCRSPFCGRYAASNCCPHLIASTNLLRFPCSGVSRTHPQQTLLQSLLIQQFICSSCLLKANVFLREYPYEWYWHGQRICSTSQPWGVHVVFCSLWQNRPTERGEKWAGKTQR